MKNVLLGMIGGFLILYTAVISLSIYSISTRKNELENCLSQIVEDVLEANYVPEELRSEETRIAGRADIEQQVRDAVGLRIPSDSELQITILACDMEKGILSVRVDESYTMPNGATRNWYCAKTAVIDRKKEPEDYRTIRFVVDGSDYKVYERKEGESYPVPKNPEGSFLYWKAEDNNAVSPWNENATVNGDDTWIAVFAGN